MYSLDSCPLSAKLDERLDIVQRKIIRNIVGRTFIPDASWEEIGRKLKIRVSRCLSIHPIREWSLRIKSTKLALLLK